jgi:hypothetical protein
MNLYEITGAIAQLTELMEEEGFPAEVFQDTIESLGAENALEGVVKAIRNAAADAEAYKAEAERLTEKRRQAEEKVDRLKKLILDYLTVTNQKKASAGIFSVSRRSTKSCELLDESIIPTEYLIQQPPKVDKKTILAKLKEGEEIPGAQLKESESIAIK